MPKNLKAGFGGNFTVTLNDNDSIDTVVHLGDAFDRTETVRTVVIPRKFGEVNLGVSKSLSGKFDESVEVTIPWEHAKAFAEQILKALNA